MRKIVPYSGEGNQKETFLHFLNPVSNDESNGPSSLSKKLDAIEIFKVDKTKKNTLFWETGLCNQKFQ